MTPLYGHESIDTAYMVNDYPYGRLRCRIRFWLEFSPSKGYRFCSQTENPKTLVWNAPKKSTYVKIAAGMFLDDKGHCTWNGISEYSNIKECQKFLNDFNKSPNVVLRNHCRLRSLALRKLAQGSIYFTINGEEQKRTPEEIARWTSESQEWESLAVFP